MKRSRKEDIECAVNKFRACERKTSVAVKREIQAHENLKKTLKNILDKRWIQYLRSMCSAGTYRTYIDEIEEFVTFRDDNRKCKFGIQFAECRILLGHRRMSLDVITNTEVIAHFNVKKGQYILTSEGTLNPLPKRLRDYIDKRKYFISWLFILFHMDYCVELLKVYDAPFKYAEEWSKNEKQQTIIAIEK